MPTTPTFTAQIDPQLSPKSKALLDLLKTLNSDTAATTPAAPLTNPLTPPAMGEYWPGQGGHYICALPALLGMPERHLIFGTTEAEDLTFGPSKEIAGAGSHIDGATNTAALLKSGEEHQAAQWAHAYTADGHTDFFLPSRYDLFMAHLCAPKLFKTSGWYWSSTQGSRNLAFVQDFEGGHSDWLNKGDGHRVRACRRASLSALIA